MKPQALIYGNGETRTITIDGRTLSPRRSQQVFNHSPDGFNWGYAGSGPAQTALALLLEAGLPAERAGVLHQAFKRDVIQTLPVGEDFTMPGSTVLDWIEKQLDAEAA